jgi:hypothetical protein
MKILQLLVVLCAFFLVGADPQGCDTPSKSVFHNTVSTGRMADFNYTVIVNWQKDPWNPAPWKEHVFLDFEPTRVGAYYLEGHEQVYKLVSPSANEPLTLGVYKFEFGGSTDQVKVTWSDGKSIERTVIPTDK